MQKKIINVVIALVEIFNLTLTFNFWGKFFCRANIVLLLLKMQWFGPRYPDPDLVKTKTKN